MSEQRCQGPWCHRPVEQAATGRPRHYCSDNCRAAAYRERRDQPCGAEIVYHVAGSPDLSRAKCQRKKRDCDGHHQAQVTITTVVQQSLVP